MLLPRGKTGFLGQKESAGEKRLATADLKVFRTHCHAAARSTGGKVRAIEEPWQGDMYCSPCRNFTIAVIDHADASICLLLNGTFLAFSKPLSPGRAELDFVDCGSLTEFFQSAADYTMLRSEELWSPLTRASCADLSPNEQEKVRYFRPARVGDVIFNYWD